MTWKKFELARLEFICGESEFDYSNPNVCFGSKGGGGGTTVASSAPPADVTAAYDTAINAAQTAASAPLQQYGGPELAGFTPDQLQAFQTVSGTQGASTPYLNTASSDVQAGTTPLWSGVQQFSPDTVQQYESPYTSDVLNTTMAAENNQDAQQQQQVVGNAISSGAWGGDRSAVAQAQLAGQQAIANNATNANIENTGYNTALGEFNTQQQNQLGANEANAYLNEQAGSLNTGLAAAATNDPIAQASAQLQSGALQQQLGQEELNIPNQQFQLQQAYPLQIANYFANIAEGIGSDSGGTGSTTAPGASTASQIGGLGLAGLGIAAGSAASAKSGGRMMKDGGTARAGLASGGLPDVLGQGGSEDIASGIPDMSLSIVPGTSGGHGGGPPKASSATTTSPTGGFSQPSAGSLTSAGKGINSIYNWANGMLSSDPSFTGALATGNDVANAQSTAAFLNPESSINFASQMGLSPNASFLGPTADSPILTDFGTTPFNSVAGASADDIGADAVGSAAADAGAEDIGADAVGSAAADDGIFSMLGEAAEYVGEAVAAMCVICTALHKRGRISRAIWLGDQRYGLSMPRDVFEGYLIWASPVARLIERSALFTSLIAPFFVPVAKEAAFTMGVYNKSSWLGRRLLRATYLLSSFCGKRRKNVTATA